MVRRSGNLKPLKAACAAANPAPGIDVGDRAKLRVTNLGEILRKYLTVRLIRRRAELFGVSFPTLSTDPRQAPANHLSFDEVASRCIPPLPGGVNADKGQEIGPAFVFAQDLHGLVGRWGALTVEFRQPLIACHHGMLRLKERHAAALVPRFD